MKVEMVMPQMGESIAEGTILKWLKKKGDQVEQDENILEISTDKVDSEIPAPASGKIVALLAEEGDTVPVGNVIAHIETDAGAGDGEKPPEEAEEPKEAEAEAPAEEEKRKEEEQEEKEKQEAKQKEKEGAEAKAAAEKETEKKEQEAEKKQRAERVQEERAREERDAVEEPERKGAAETREEGGAVPARDGSGRFYSPLVRSMARAEGVSLDELSDVEGSGRGGRVTKDDLLAYLERRGREEAPSPRKPEPAAVSPPAPGGAEKPEVAFAGAPIEPKEVRSTSDGKIEVVPMDHIRKKIAEHMVRSKATSPHVASVGEAEMTRIVRHREANKEAFQRREGFKLTYTTYIVQAVVRALKEFPYVNASIEESNILIKRYVNMGIAVAVDYGLIVPVVRQADTLNFLGLARAINDLATRARAKALKPEEVSGGTFSVTNMGTIGTLFGVPIIAQPQVGILGIGTIQKRPVIRDDAIAIRDMMYLCLSYDHRLIDGAMGGSFVQRVVHYLETMELE